MSARIAFIWVSPNDVQSEVTRHHDVIGEDPIDGQSCNRNFPTILRPLPHFVYRLLTQNHAVMLTVGVITLHVALEKVS